MHWQNTYPTDLMWKQKHSEGKNVETNVKIATRHLDLYYGENHALKDISLDLHERQITA